MSDILIHRSQITANTLNTRIDFDSAFGVDSDGNIIDAPDAYSPDVEHCEVNGVDIQSDDWEAFSGGYTGQYGYSGPVMHASEFIGGRLAEDILNTPGTYVICSVDVNCDPDAPECYDGDKEDRMNIGCYCEPAGWVVLKYTE